MKKMILLLLVAAQLHGAASSRGEDKFWLHKAAAAGNVRVINENKAKITPEALKFQDSSGLNPLHKAIVNGQLNTVELLVELGANLEDRTGAFPETKKNPGSDTALGLALKELRRPAKQELRTSNDREAKPNSKVFYDIVDFLVKNGANLNATNAAKATPLHLLAGFLYEDAEGVTPREKHGKVRFEDINELRRPDLASAAQLIIDTGAREETPVNVNAQDMFGKTPLHWSTIHGYPELTQTLIQNGAQVNAQDLQGQTPLMGAARSGFLDIMRLLIQNGANVNLQDEVKGRTPLHWLQRMREGARLKRGDQMTKRRALIGSKLLIENGANPLIKDKPWTDLSTGTPIPGRSVIEWSMITSPWVGKQEELLLFLDPRIVHISFESEGSRGDTSQAAASEGSPQPQAASSSSSDAGSSEAPPTQASGWWQNLSQARKRLAISLAKMKKFNLLNQLMQEAVDQPGAMDSYKKALAAGDSMAVEFNAVSGM